MKVVVITGASSGIGLALAKRLSKQGYRVYGLSRRLVETKDFTSISCDITDENKVRQVLEQIYMAHQRMDIIVNNAGMGISGSVENTRIEDIKFLMDVNLIGLFTVCKHALPYLRKQAKSKIINIGSVAGELSIPFQAYYSASKAAVRSFGEALANEVAPYGVSVCTILPGDIKTGFTASRRKNEGELPIYEKRVLKSLSVMEKDEQSGMTVDYAAKVIYKVIKRRRTPLVKTIGMKYKLFVFVKRFLPSKFINKVVGMLYAFKKD